MLEPPPREMRIAGFTSKEVRNLRIFLTRDLPSQIGFDLAKELAPDGPNPETLVNLLRRIVRGSELQRSGRTAQLFS